MWVFSFSSFVSFLATFPVLHCEIFIFHVFQCFSHLSSSYSVCVSFSTFFNFLTIFHVLQCVFLLSHVFHCLSPYFISYSLRFTFSLFVSFLALFHVLQCFCLILQVFQFSRHNPGPTVYIIHFSRFQYFSQYSRSYNFVSHFPRFSVFSPQSWSYSAYFSCLTFFNVSCHIPSSIVLLSHFLSFSVFLAIFQVLQCFFFSFCMFFNVSRLIPGVECAFFLFHLFQCFLPHSRSYTVCV